MISVVVCTYNRSGVLARMLASFFEQEQLDALGYELILIDNNSTDNTRAVTEQWDKSDQFRYVFEEKQGLSAARNRGIAQARGELIAFLDDDVIVDKNWLTNLQQCFDETQADAVGGRSYLIFEAEPPEWLTERLRLSLSEVNLGPERKAVERGNGLYGLNMAFRKATLEKVGKFDEGLGRRGKGLLAGEETVVFSRIADTGGTIMYEPNAVVGHIIEKERLEWAYFKRLSSGLGTTWALSEETTGPAGRARRVAESLRDVAVDCGKWCWTALRGTGDCERRKVWLHLLWMWGSLRGRLERLLRG